MLAWVEDLSGEEHLGYDARGRIEWTVKRIPDPQFLSLSASGGEGRGEVAIGVGLVSYRTGFEYDSLDRLTRVTYPDNDFVTYEYNARNLLRRIRGGPSGYIISNILYRTSGQLRQIDYGNGVRTTYDYDPRLRLVRLHTVAPAEARGRAEAQGQAPRQNVSLAPSRGEGQGEGLELIHFLYDFDGVSNIRSITDARPASQVPADDPRRNTQVFTYDDLYRLTSATYNPPNPATINVGSIHYRYDRIGNMLAQTSDIQHTEKGLPVANLGEMESGGPAGRWNRIGRAAADPPGPHALTAIRNPQSPIRNYEYDANGNMTVIDGLTNTWDFKDRLVGVESAEMRAAYTYDYTDRRIIKRVEWKLSSPPGRGAGGEGVTTVTYINKYFEVREHDAPTKYVWNGDTRVARVTGSLNTNVRVQRLRLWPGWNLCSLAVTVSNALDQLENSSFVIGHSSFRWNPDTLDWEAVQPAATLPAGTVLWLCATTNATLTITGIYADPTNRVVGPTGDFLSSAGLEAWDFKSEISNSPCAAAWTYDAPFTRWLSWLPAPLSTLNPHTSTNFPKKGVSPALSHMLCHCKARIRSQRTRWPSCHSRSFMRQSLAALQGASPRDASGSSPRTPVPDDWRCTSIRVQRPPSRGHGGTRGGQRENAQQPGQRTSIRRSPS